jgi:hypothetical protein
MGSRANYVVVDSDGFQLYYSHWGAQYVHSQLAAGPDSALRFIRAQRLADPETDWLDERWCEGAALVDVPAKHLLYFGGFEYLYELDNRRAYAALLAQTWPQWTVRWAYQELVDVIAHLGLDPAIVATPDVNHDPFRGATGLRPADADDLASGYWALLTVRDNDGGLLAWPVARHLNHAAWAGERLLESLPAKAAARSAISGRPPHWGLHIDVADRRVGLWTASTVGPWSEHAPALWPGWAVEFWQDRYEQHLAACDGAVLAPPVDVARGFDELAAGLDLPDHDPVASAFEVADLLRADGSAVVVNPAIAHHVEIPGEEQDRQRIAAALAAARIHREQPR